jgi:hypothetical protein
MKFQQENNHQEEQQHRPRDDVVDDASNRRGAATTIGAMNNRPLSSSALYARMWNGAKYMVALALVCDAALRLQGRMLHPSRISTTTVGVESSSSSHAPGRRRVLQEAVGRNDNNSSIIIDAAAVATVGPSYMQPLFEDLQERQKLFTDATPEEIKYWFEYTGPMQVRLTRRPYQGTSVVCIRLVQYFGFFPCSLFISHAGIFFLFYRSTSIVIPKCDPVPTILRAVTIQVSFPLVLSETLVEQRNTRSSFIPPTTRTWAMAMTKTTTRTRMSQM